MPTPHILVIQSSVREGRAGDKVVHWLLGVVQARTDLTAELADLRDYPLPNYALPGSPKQLEGGYTGLPKAWGETVQRADGIVIVTPEYNHSFPASLKNALDHVYTPWNHKPLGLVTYGGPSGGIRVAQSLKLVAIELQMVPMRMEVNIPLVHRAFDEHGQLTDTVQVRRASEMLGQVVWYANVLKGPREALRAAAARGH